jgi:hypothetical protein
MAKNPTPSIRTALPAIKEMAEYQAACEKADLESGIRRTASAAAGILPTTACSISPTSSTSIFLSLNMICVA